MKHITLTFLFLISLIHSQSDNNDFSSSADILDMVGASLNCTSPLVLNSDGNQCVCPSNQTYN